MPIRIARHRQLPVHGLLGDRIGREVEHHVARAHRQRAVGCQSRLHGAVVDSLRMQLLVNPLVHAHRRYRLHIARARPKRQPVQRMQRSLLRVHGVGGLLLLGINAAPGDQKHQGSKADLTAIHRLVLPACDVYNPRPTRKVAQNQREGNTCRWNLRGGTGFSS